MAITINSRDGWTRPDDEQPKVRARPGANADFSQALADQQEADTGGRQSREFGGGRWIDPDDAEDAATEFSIEGRRITAGLGGHPRQDTNNEIGPTDEAGDERAVE